MKIVPEEKKILDINNVPENINDYVRGKMYKQGHNACRQTVLNNLKSKEMVEGIARVITKTYIEEATAKFPLQAKDIVILSNAIQKALIQ